MLFTLIMWYLIFCVATGLVLGSLARRDGGSFRKWLALGALLPFYAIPRAVLIMMRGVPGGGPRVVGTKKCSYCHHKVDIHARHCPKCGYEFIDLS